MGKTVYIVSAVRTPIGKFGGMLADFTHPDLGTIAVCAALEIFLIYAYWPAFRGIFTSKMEVG